MTAYCNYTLGANPKDNIYLFATLHLKTRFIYCNKYNIIVYPSRISQLYRYITPTHFVDNLMINNGRTSGSAALQLLKNGVIVVPLIITTPYKHYRRTLLQEKLIRHSILYCPLALTEKHPAKAITIYLHLKMENFLKIHSIPEIIKPLHKQFT